MRSHSSSDGFYGGGGLRSFSIPLWPVVAVDLPKRKDHFRLGYWPLRKDRGRRCRTIRYEHTP